MFHAYTAKISTMQGSEIATVQPGWLDGHAARKLRSLGCVEIRLGTFEATPRQLRQFLNYQFPVEAPPRTRAQKRASMANLKKAWAAQKANASPE